MSGYSHVTSELKTKNGAPDPSSRCAAASASGPAVRRRGDQGRGKGGVTGAPVAAREHAHVELMLTSAHRGLLERAHHLDLVFGLHILYELHHVVRLVRDSEHNLGHADRDECLNLVLENRHVADCRGRGGRKALSAKGVRPGEVEKEKASSGRLTLH